MQFHRSGYLAGVEMPARGSQLDAILEDGSMIRSLLQYSQSVDYGVVLHHPRHDVIKLIIRERLVHEHLKFCVRGSRRSRDRLHVAEEPAVVQDCEVVLGLGISLPGLHFEDCDIDLDLLPLQLGEPVAG